MATAIQNLRPRLARHRPILVFHIDQPSNDFNSLFEVLSSDPDRYSLQGQTCFRARSEDRCTKPVLPSAGVRLGWRSYAAISPTLTLIGRGWRALDDRPVPTVVVSRSQIGLPLLVMVLAKTIELLVHTQSFCRPEVFSYRQEQRFDDMGLDLAVSHSGVSYFTPNTQTELAAAIPS